MHHLAIVLSLSVLGACATPVALRGQGGLSDARDLRDCPDGAIPCAAGGTGDGATWLVYGVGAAALGLGVGALIREIVRWRPSEDPRARS